MNSLVFPRLKLELTHKHVDTRVVPYLLGFVFLYKFLNAVLQYSTTQQEHDFKNSSLG